MGSFPDEIVYNILSWLPLMSLIRFTCVCKYWLSIIRDPAFGKLHFSRSESNPAILVVTYELTGEKNTIKTSYMKQEGLKLVAGKTSLANITVSPHCWRLVGTCDGLLCFATLDSKETNVMVCNPVTKESVILPKSSPCQKSSHRVTYAFGFDLTTKKYKVVRLLCRHYNACITAAEVYTLGDIGYWRKVEGFNRVPSVKYAYVYADGAVHWLVDPHPVNCLIHCFPVSGTLLPPLYTTEQVQAPQHERIISFDLGKEEFRMMKHIGIGPASNLAELGKCLSVVDNSPGTLVEVFTTNDYCNEDSWKKEYTIPVRKSPAMDWNCFPRLVCAHEHNGVLLVWFSHTLISYERESSVRRELKRSLISNSAICSCYRASLVPLNLANGV